MCGILAIFAYGPDAPPVDREPLRRGCDRMACRGPDDHGVWISADQRVGFGHRRLAIIDLTTAGAQPMHDPDTGSVIVFNGEIYNFRELRADLVKQGHRFRSESDTEVLLKLYAEKGEAMVHELRGMFAFAIWDARRRGLFLARDHFGIKPLYYADDGKSIRVASEVKALVAVGGVDTSPDPAGHVGFFLWGHVPEPYTIYRGMRSLRAGSTMWVADGRVEEVHEYASVTALLREAEQAPEEPVRDAVEVRQRLRELMLESVRAHLVSDVEVGVFLSAGLDSTTIAALATEAGGRLRTVTLGFEEFRGTALDETPLAELVAKQLGANHTTVWVTRGDFADERRRLFDRMDQPTTDGVNTYIVARAAASAGLKVVLSGLGGDELFGGYPSFRELPRLVSALRSIPYTAGMGRAARAISAPILRRVTSPKYASVLEYGGDYAGAYLLRRGMFMPWELSRVLDRDIVREGLEELRTLERLRDTVNGLQRDRFKVSALESSWYMRSQLLRDTDWTSMTHSVEVRTPLVDWSLWKGVTPLVAAQPSMNKMTMASTVTLPSPVLNRAKTGFGIPIREWLALEGQASHRGLRGWAQHVYGRVAQSNRWLTFVTDAYGGRGGIAKYVRDLLEASCLHPAVTEVVALPRVASAALPDAYPEGLSFHTASLGGRWRYAREAFRVTRSGHFDAVICGHIHLLPIAVAAALYHRVPLILVIYGLEAWKPRGLMARQLLKRVNTAVAISEFTKQRFIDWSGYPGQSVRIVPCGIDLSLYGPGPKRADLLARHGLDGRTVLLTMGRIDAADRYKGFDEMLNVLPAIAQHVPSVSYLIVGDGPDKLRLQQKVQSMGLDERVVFAGWVSEEEKTDYFRLADAYVMPSRGEGFGIVYLEAMACGIPTIASRADASREAVRNGMLGQVVDPDLPQEIVEAVLHALTNETRRAPSGLDHFSQAHFRRRWIALMEYVVGSH